jgi:DNA-binding response OmpR family regulator
MPAGKKRILVADDDLQLLKLLKLELQYAGYTVLMARDGEQALSIFEDEAPDMLLLDIGMPGINGFEVCRRVRETSAMPIIFVTAREQMHDKLKAFYLGADDFLTKPFDIEELLARVQAIFRRIEALSNEPETVRNHVTVGDLTISYTWQQVSMAGQEIALTPTEYSLISYMARHAGHVLTHCQLLEHIWSSEYAGDLHTLQVNINRLRRKLEPDPSRPRYILTKPGVGYMLSAQTQLAQSQTCQALEKGLCCSRTTAPSESRPEARFTP